MTNLTTIKNLLANQTTADDARTAERFAVDGGAIERDYSEASSDKDARWFLPGEEDSIRITHQAVADLVNAYRARLAILRALEESSADIAAMTTAAKVSTFGA